MAASSASGYGAYNPNAIDPFPVEQTLAQIVGQNNPAEAYNMLKTYQTQNETSRGNYDYAMAGQHEFAKQQLAQQLQEQYIKSAMDAVQHPGGLSVLQGMAPDALANVDPGVIGGVETGLARAQDASTFEKGASGAYHAVQAGFPPDATGLARLTGGVTGAPGTPLQMQIEAMKEGHADARARAAAGAAANAEPNRTVQWEGPHGTETASFNPKRFPNQGAVDAWLDAQGVPRRNAGPAREMPPEAQALGPGGANQQQPNQQQQPAAPPGRVPGLPPKPNAPAARKPMTPDPGNALPGADKLQAQTIAILPKYAGTPEHKNITAGMATNNGKPLVGVGKDGKLHVMGADGQLY